MNAVYVQYGTGPTSCPAGWINYDVSPTLVLQKIPALGSILVPRKQRFPDGIQYGDIRKGLPVTAGTVAGIYCSHVLEHLCLEDCLVALANTFKVLQPGGVFRLIVPDLAERAKRYVASVERGEADASLKLLMSCHLGKERRARGLIATLRELIGNSAHLWMWDEHSLRRALADAGFVGIRRCAFGDAEDPMFARVEDQRRFIDLKFEPPLQELALEARKPA